MRPLSAGKMATESCFARELIASLSALLIFDLGCSLVLTIVTISLSSLLSVFSPFLTILITINNNNLENFKSC